MLQLESPVINLEQLAEQLKVLAEPKRLSILQTLMDGYQCNCELGDVLKMPPNLISHHLRVLREAGLVVMERDQQDARWVYYSINVEAMKTLLTHFGLFFDPARIKPRRDTCGPNSSSIQLVELSSLAE
ncbi:MAG: winged helix-turn-helix transcriptional regulator [Caldilineaceae bacterium]|nr:winged helix-turn-helix transcriptional regulator [Caldilineaceae bacterium]